MMGGGGYMGPTPGQMAPGPAPAPAAAPRRLDPDQMPNPVGGFLHHSILLVFTCFHMTLHLYVNFFNRYK